MVSYYKYPYGYEKDKPIHECKKGSLIFLVKNLKVGNPKYDAVNIALAKECLLYLKAPDIYGIIEEIDVDHPAWQLCNDSINAITDSKGRPKTSAKPTAAAAPKELPVIQLQPKDTTAVIKEIRALIDDLYKHASQLQRLFDEYTESGVTTKSSEHTPY